MRTRLKFFLVVSLSFFIEQSLAQTQDFYPLQVGNMWQYEIWYQGMLSGYQTTKVDTEVVMSNGKKYFHVSNERFFIRMGDSLKSYIYDSANLDHDTSTVELIIDEFDAKAGDTWISYKYDGTRAQMDRYYSTSIFNQTDEVRVISYYNGPLWVAGNHYSRKFGMIYSSQEAGPSYTLVGAKINNVTYGTLTSIFENAPGLNTDFKVMEPYPNPFNSSVTIQYEIHIPTHVFIRVYNLLGKFIRSLGDKVESAGSHVIAWDLVDDWGQWCPIGVYFIQVQMANNSIIKKVIAIK